MGLEPGDKIGVEANGELLLDGPVKKPALGSAPVPLLRRVACVDLILWHSGKLLKLAGLLGSRGSYQGSMS